MSDVDPTSLVLSHYLPLRVSVTPLGNRGGFSGARLWRCGDFCLRRWPESTSKSHLTLIHQLMTAARETARLDFIPAVLSTRQGGSIVECDGGLWDLTSWMPGLADFHQHPSRERLEAVCVALALVHRAWERLPIPRGSCPAIQRRLDTWTRWKSLVDAGWSPPVSDILARRAGEQLRRFGRITANALLLHASVEWPLQPCLCDVWHDHLLFEENRLTGLIDYGEVKIDHVSVDLARMLGSLIEDDDEQWRVGIEAYRSVRPLRDEEVELARLLDCSGVVLGMSNWVRWLYHEGRVFDDMAAARSRLTVLVERVERWRGGDPLLLV